MVNASLPRRKAVNESVVNFGARDLFLVQLRFITLNVEFTRRRTRLAAPTTGGPNALKMIDFFSEVDPIK
jgi:hypothetical protein